MITDGYTAYQQLLPKLAGIQQCAAHVIRRCRAVAGLGPGSLQSWAADVIEILREAHRLTEEARARGEPADAEFLAKLRERYDEAITFGINCNRHRDNLTAFEAITAALASKPWLPLPPILVTS